MSCLSPLWMYTRYRRCLDPLQVWDIFEEKPLFKAMHKAKNNTEEHYSELHHLAEIQARIGSPPAEFHVNYPLGAGLYHKGNVTVPHSQPLVA